MLSAMAGPFACLGKVPDRGKEQPKPIVVSVVNLEFESGAGQSKSVRGFENDDGSRWPQVRHDTCLYG